MAQRLTEIILQKYKAEDIPMEIVAKIDEDVDLFLEGYDIAKQVEEWWAHSDCECWLGIPGDYKDTVLVWLIDKRFQSDSQFKRRLDGKGIPSEFGSWV